MIQETSVTLELQPRLRCGPGAWGASSLRHIKFSYLTVEGGLSCGARV